MKPRPGIPRILLVEDDPVSRAWLIAATRVLPADVDAAASVAEALALAHGAGHDLWLFDANLPDGSGIQLLSQLRACGALVPALAHTASWERAEHDALLEAGFTEVLTKPVDAPRWQASLRRVLAAGSRANADMPAFPAGDPPVWDDQAASAALGGNDCHIAALRALFLEELPWQRDAIRDGDAGTRRLELHRLRAACGFAGAARLAAAATQLHRIPDDDRALQQFLHAAADTLA